MRLILLATLVGAGAFLTAGAQAVVPGTNGKIVLASNRDDPSGANYELYRANADGSGVARLTNAAGNDRTPAWSPDGTRIAFSSDRANPNPDPTKTVYDIWTMNADGSGARELFTGASEYREGDWQALPNIQQAISAVRSLLAHQAQAAT